MPAIGSTQRGAVAAILGALCFGAAIPFGKILLGHYDPVLLAGILYVSSGIGLAILRFAALRTKTYARSAAPLSRGDLPYFFGSILSGGVLAPVALNAGVLRGEAQISALVMNLEVVFTALLAAWLFRERLGKRGVLGVAIVFAGAAIVGWTPPKDGVAGTSLLGPGLVALSCLLWAIDNNLTEKMSGKDPLQITLWKGLIGGTTNLALAVSLGQKIPRDPALLGWAALLGFAGYGLSVTGIVYAMRHLGTSRTIGIFSANPAFSVLIAWAVLRERPQPIVLGGAALIAIGVGLLLKARRGSEHPVPAVPHSPA